MSYLKQFKYELLALAGAVAVLWTMLLPGYILTLDLVWTPHVPLIWNASSFNNAYPVYAFFHFLSLLTPGWVGEKVMLFGLFFLLFYIPMRFMPFIKGQGARVFVGALYALNPFVYARMLAGHWLVLFGYALLPLFLWALIEFTEELRSENLRSDLSSGLFKVGPLGSQRSAIYLALSLFAIGLFSVHFLYLSLFISFVWILAHANVKLLKYFAFALALFLIGSSYWLAPAMLRHAPLEARFTSADFVAFAAAPNANVPVMLNTAVLGGYWGEGTVWNLYFVWPQSNPLFWVAAGVLALLVLFGVFTALRRRDLRFTAILLLVIALVAYVTALGAADTPFKAFNVFLYAHVPLWNGLRDSQKIAGVLALVYTVFAGLGAEALLRSDLKPRLFKVGPLGSKPRLFKVGPLNSLPYIILLLVVPFFFGMYEWGGFQSQLQPVWYPQSWYSAKAIVDSAPAGQKVLVLPWHGYLSLSFDHQLVVANPAPGYFGSRVVAGRSIDTGAVHDEEVDPQYRALDSLLSTTTPPSAQTLLAELHKDNINYVFIMSSTASPAEANWTDSARAVIDTLPGTVLQSGLVYIKRLVTP